MLRVYWSRRQRCLCRLLRGGALAMMKNSKPGSFVRTASQTRQPAAGCPGNAACVVETLQSHLTAEARERTIQQVVGGGRFCAVMLDDGGVGMANLCPDVCGEPSRQVSDRLPRPGTPAAAPRSNRSPSRYRALLIESMMKCWGPVHRGHRSRHRRPSWPQRSGHQSVAHGDAVTMVALGKV